MAKKSRITDEMIMDAVKKDPHGSIAAIIKDLGASRNQTLSARVKEAKDMINSKVSDAGASLNFTDIKVEDRLKKDGKLLIVTSVNHTYITAQRMDGKVENISRNQFSKGDYTRLGKSDGSGPVTSYFIEPGIEIGDIPVNGATLKELSESDKEEVLAKLKERAAQTDARVSATNAGEPEITMKSLIESMSLLIKKVAEDDICALKKIGEKYL